jgi:6-phosphogluconolactonase (cycloisomerase 2 family)
MMKAMFNRMWCRSSHALLTLPLLMLTIMAGCNSGDSPPSTMSSTASSVSMVIGPAGGTITHPSGVEVVIPAGALDADTTIGIARNSSGAPARFANRQPADPIYEFTPHDLVFNKPVRFFMPVPAGTTTATPLIASFGQGWEALEAVVSNGFAQWSRNTFSWASLNTPCANYGNDPHPCAHSSGKAFVTATPSTAITQLTGVENPLGFFTAVGNAGSYAVNTTTLTDLHLTMLYRGAPDCTNGTARLKRLIPGAGGPAQLVTPPGEVSAVLDANKRGTVTFDIPWDPSTTTTTAYVVQFSCDRPNYNPGGGYTTGGFDWFTFIPSASGVPGFTYGGTITGLTSSGLELQNGQREVLTVSANSTAFTFLTRLASGAAYNISVRTQPAGQHCTVQNGTSSLTTGITSDVADIVVTCTGITIGGTVSGLTGTGLVLRNNGGNDLPIAANGPFTFTNPVAVSATYNVTVFAQPTGQTCTVTNGSGTTGITAVTNVAVTCVAGGTPSPLALVANSGGNTLSVYRVGSTGTLSALGSVATGSFPFRIAVTPNGLFAYVTNLVGNTLSSYSINSTTGVLSSIAGSSPGTTNPYGIAMDPQGRFLWVANRGGVNTVSAFGINGTSGVLSAPSSTPTGSLPYGVAAHPTGNFVYVTNESGNSVSAYSVNAGTGALTLVGTLTNSGLSPHGIAVTPNGNFVYMANFGGSDISIFSVSTTTGGLTAAGFASTNTNPESIAVHPNGLFLYVTRPNSNVVSIFSINGTTGALTAVGSPVSTGTVPSGLAINAAGTVLYVTNLTGATGNSVSTFSIDTATGSLTSLGATVATGTGPEGVAVVP